MVLCEPMEPAAELHIGQLAGRLGLNPRTIRFYEKAGVLPEPQRSEGGFRLYGDEDEQRLRFIKAAQRLGLKLDEIRKVLAFRDRGERPCPYVEQLIGAQLGEIDQRMHELQGLKRDLTQLKQRMAAHDAPQADNTFCRYIEAGSSSDARA